MTTGIEQIKSKEDKGKGRKKGKRDKGKEIKKEKLSIKKETAMKFRVFFPLELLFLTTAARHKYLRHKFALRLTILWAQMTTFIGIATCDFLFCFPPSPAQFRRLFLPRTFATTLDRLG